MTIATLTKALLADRDRESTQHNIVQCFVCAHRFVYRGRRDSLNGKFCSLGCQDWYDAGKEPISEEIIYRWRDGKPMQKAANGFKITCTYCRKDFESKGLRCCSAECERSYRERGPVTAKRRCVSCSAPIPTWRNGRRVSKSVRFCGDKCRKRAARAAA